ncbi:protein kinase [Acetobacter pasteurianus]|nr:protein kinase [Acetobacter pasteurianus]
MADIFDMDGYEQQQQQQLLANGISKLSLGLRHNPDMQLNYKLLDTEDLNNDINDKNCNNNNDIPEVDEDQGDEDDSFNENHAVRDYYPTESAPIRIHGDLRQLQVPNLDSSQRPPFARPRRKSSIVSSYEVRIGQEDFISSSLVIDNTTCVDGTESIRALQAPIYKPKLTDFEPIKVLGKGSYGKVLLVREVRTGKLFALKQLQKASLIINQDEGDVPESDPNATIPTTIPTTEPKLHAKNYQRTLSEKQILEIVNHPSIVKLYYAFQDNNKLYLILEYLQGGELFHHLSMEKFMSEKSAAYYIAQCSLALHYLHTRVKVIYRDLKPENCMLNARGDLVLTDFGLSKVAPDSDDPSKKLNSMTGTIQYMAPEVIEGQEYDYLVDWWSLGCVAFDLLTGSPPFPGLNADKVLQKIKNFKKNLKFPFYLSTDAKDILRKLLQVDPNKRLNVDEDWERFKKHNFFRHIDWRKLETIDSFDNKHDDDDDDDDFLPPILPIITDPILAENFDSDFTEMEFTPHQHASHLSLKQTFYMKDFSYINPKFLDNFKPSEEKIVE